MSCVEEMAAHAVCEGWSYLCLRPSWSVQIYEFVLHAAPMNEGVCLPYVSRVVGFIEQWQHCEVRIFFIFAWTYVFKSWRMWQCFFFRVWWTWSLIHSLQVYWFMIL